MPDAMITERSDARLSLARRGRGRAFDFSVAPGRDWRRALAGALDLRALESCRLTGRLVPEGREDWRLEARLEADAIQDCAVTLAPVRTRIDEAVTRRFLAAPPPPPEGGEAEMPEDDSIEPLADPVDLGDVLAEALALALPPFPRAADAPAGARRAAPPGVSPLSDEDVKPFAGLASLMRDREGKG